MAAEIEPGRDGGRAWEPPWRLESYRTQAAEACGFLLGGLAELCYPAACVLCHGPLDGPHQEEPGTGAGSSAASLCFECRVTLLATAPEAACTRCGRPQPKFTSAAEMVEEARALGIGPSDRSLPGGRASGAGLKDRDSLPTCRWCRRRPGNVVRTVTLGMYRDVMREAVIAAKRRAFQPLALALGEMLGCRVRQDLGAVPVGAVTYVPSHWWRRWCRGGCPAQLLAQQVGRAIAVPVLPLLQAVRRTAKQGTLSDASRRKNVRGAFKAKKGYALSAPRVLVVDDVWTTGATLQEAAGVIRQGYDAEVYAAVVARAIGTHDG